jgi:hypothetical protein
MTSDTTFDRLREANPFRPATVGAVDDLFARITAEPGDARLAARKPRRRRRRRTVGVALAFVVIALGSSAFATVHYMFGKGIVGASVSRAEYRRAQTILELPPGYGWPTVDFADNTVMNRGAGGSFAVSIDQSAWECYWVKSIRERNGAGQRRAQAVLDDLMQHRILIAPAGASENWSPPASTPWPSLVFADDGGYQFKQRLYAEAAAGRPAGLIQSCRANAPAGWH